jgi:hypothetical protein
MIARNVHQHTPANQLEHQFFSQFKIKDTEANDCIINIDDFPCYA